MEKFPMLELWKYFRYIAQRTSCMKCFKQECKFDSSEKNLFLYKKLSITKFPHELYKPLLSLRSA